MFVDIIECSFFFFVVLSFFFILIFGGVLDFVVLV